MRRKICFVVAVPITAKAFLRDHMQALSKDYDIYLMGHITDKESVKDLPLTGFISIDIERSISIVKDCGSVYQAWKYFKKMRFDAVHSVTPKAGLVTAIAGWLAGVKHRTHIFTGQVWATRKGMMRGVLKTIDKIIAKLDNHILVDGKSQRKFLIDEGILKEGQAEVFANGSIAGVNAERFSPNKKVRDEERDKIGINKDALTYIFLGRLNRDKGINELFAAFNRLAGEENDVFLLVVGYDEENFAEKVEDYPNIKEGNNFYCYGPTRVPERVLNAGDIFILPTYREGFGSSVIEAASVGLPCICSDAYGVLDAYKDRVTGLRCHVGDVQSLYECMKEMHDDRTMVKQMGENSRNRALHDFNVEPIVRCWVNFYHDILRV